MANLAVLTDNGRPFDHGAIFNHRAFADENLLPDECLPLARVLQAWSKVLSQILLDPWQSCPCKLALLEDRRVFCLGQIKQIGWFEHGEEIR